MPRAEQFADALHAFVAQAGREPRRFAARQTVGRHRAGDVLAVADRLGEHAAQSGFGQRVRVPADAAGIFDNRRRPCPNRLEGADADHQRRFVALQQAAWPDGKTRRIGKSEVLIESALERGSEMRVAVDQPGEQRLVPAVVDVRVRARPEQGIGRSNCGNPVSFDREPDVLLHRVHRDDRRVCKDDAAAGRRLSVAASRIEEKSGSGTRSGQQFAPREIDWAHAR